MDNIIVSISGIASNELVITNGDIIDLSISGVTPYELIVEGTPTVPVKLSQLAQDENNRLVTDEQINIWTGKQDNLGYTPEDIAKKNVSNGYAGLDSNGFISTSALPTGSLKYKTSWNAFTNVPELQQYNVSEIGNIYLVSESGVQWGITFQVGDWAVYGSDGYISDLPYSGNMVASVNGRTGAVVLNKTDVGLPSTLDGAAVQSVNGVSGIVSFGLSGLADDECHRLVTDTEKLYWNNKSDNTSVVHLTGDEGISGVKHFEKVISESIQINNVDDGILKVISGNMVHAYAGVDYLTPTGDGSQLSGITPSQIGLGKVTNDAQVKKIESSVSGNIMSWRNSEGDIPADSGISTSSVSDTISKSHTHDNKAILDNLNQSLNSNSGVTFSNIVDTNLNNNTIIYSDNSKTLQSSYITKEELESLSGVSSNIQEQLNSKQGNLSFGNIGSSSKINITGQTSGSVIGSGVSFDVNELNINHNNLSGLASGDPHTQYQIRSEKGQSLGYASLDGGGKIPLTQLPSTLLQYQGVWDAYNNIPTLISPDASKVSYVYRVSVEGSRFGYNWRLGDWAIYNASGVIELSLNSDAVLSVFNRTGDVHSQFGDYNKSQISGLTDTDNVIFNSEVLSNLNPDTMLYSDNGRKIQSSIISRAQFETTLQNTSGVNTGDETTLSIESKLGVSSNNVVALQSLSGINTGDETNASIKFKLGASSSSNDGYLTQSDWTSFNNKISGVMTDNTLSGNGRPENVLKVEPSHIDHNLLNNLQGGVSSERYHLSNAQYSIATQTASSSLSGILSSTDWTIFNNKQNALTNPITGTGVSGQIAVFTSITGISSAPANTSSISPYTNRQYVTDNYLSGLINSPNAITASNPVSDKKYTDDSISGATFWSRSSNLIFPKYTGDSINLLSGGIKDNNSSGVIFLDDASHTYPSTYNKTIVGGVNELKNITTITKDPTGFQDPTTVSISYDSSTRKVTLTGSFKMYHRGVDVSLIDPTFVGGWISPAHDDITGFSYFLYYTGSSFVWTNSFPGFDYALICSVVYRTTDKFCLRECHGFMPWQTHEELHKTVGTYKDSGGDFSNYVPSSTVASNRRPDISACVVCDEDSHTTNSALTSKVYALRFLSSTSTANYTLDYSDIITLSGNNPYYNQFNGSTWQQTLMPSNSLASVWAFALPSGNDTTSQKYRFFFEQPQWITQAQNSSPTALASALLLEKAHQIGELTAGEPNSVALEYTGIARIIVQYTGGNWTIEDVSYILGSKYSQTSSTGTSLSSVSVNPTNLTGNGTVSNPLNTIQDIAATSSPTFAGVTISGVTNTSSLKVDLISGIVTATSGAISASPLATVLGSISGVPNGLATLDSSGKVPLSQLSISPSGVASSSSSNTIGHLVSYYNTQGTLIADSGYDVSSNATASTVVARDASSNITCSRLVCSSITDSGLTTGSIPFSISGVLSQSNSNLFWDNTNKRLGIGTATPSAALDIANYTKLGANAPSIQMKQLTGTTASTQGGSATASHGVTSSKIILITTIVNYTSGRGVPAEYSASAGYQYSCFFNSSDVTLENSASNSANILSKPFIAVIFYIA